VSIISLGDALMRFCKIGSGGYQGCESLVRSHATPLS
jgi:hypothetical protein